MMKVIHGDLVTMALNGDFDIIVHGCNCFNCMGSGIAAQIARTFPEAARVDNDTVKGDPDKLGGISVAREGSVTIVNAYTQFRYGRGQCHLDLDAVRSAFMAIALIGVGDARVGIPQIGAGLAGGNWDEIRPIIEEEMDGIDLTLVMYK